MNTWNGDMPGCNPLKCTNNCCKSKEVFYVDKEHPFHFNIVKNSSLNQAPLEIIGSKVKYNTMLSDSEAHKLLPQMEKYGITIVQKNIVDELNINISNQQLSVTTAWLLTDCLKDNGCVLVDDKPLVCKLYPFKSNIGIEGPIDFKGCSEAKAIAENSITQKNILKIRKLSGYIDNDMYKIMIKFVLETKPKKMSS